jgi:UDP-glucose 4-epimerase
MRALVTGGAGFIGSHLCDRLVEVAESVVIVDDLSTGKIKNIDEIIRMKNVKFFQQDINSDLYDVFRPGIDTVFHLAAKASVQESIQDPMGSYHVNVHGTENVLRACQDFNVHRVIFPSTCAVYGNPETLPVNENAKFNPLSPYAEQKIKGEQLCQDYVMEPFIFRLFNVMGTRQDSSNPYTGVISKFASRIHQGKPPVIFGDGNNTRDYVYVDRVVDALMLGGTKFVIHQDEIFNVGSGEQHSVNELARTMIGYQSKELEPIYRDPVKETAHIRADITKIRARYDWNPRAEEFSKNLKTVFNDYALERV